MSLGRAVPQWLSRILQDHAPAPRIYRWTVDDIVRGKATGGHDGTATTSEDSHQASKKPSRIGVQSASASAVDDGRQRIYVLGVGNMGRLFAASLAKLDNRPPITLVVHRPGLLEQWQKRPRVILHPPSSLENGNREEPESRMAWFDVEMWSETPPPARQDTAQDSTAGAHTSSAPSTEVGAISNLILATKAQDALLTVDWLRRYLSAESSVAFAQNGINKLWPPFGALYGASRFGARQPLAAGHKGPRSSPLWLACVVTHGVFSTGPFESVHASPGHVSLGAISTDGLPSGDAAGAQGAYLVQQLLAAPQLCAHWAPQSELWVIQLEKLAVNSVINPLTAILRCKNGALFASENGAASPSGRGRQQTSIVPMIIDQLLWEASAVFQALAAQGLESGGVLAADGRGGRSDALVERLQFDRLRSMVYRVGDAVKDNTSSMLQDVQSGKTTEVRELNGWIVEMARYLESVDAFSQRQVSMKAHQTMVDLVEAGAHLTIDQLGGVFLLA